MMRKNLSRAILLSTLFTLLLIVPLYPSHGEPVQLTEYLPVDFWDETYTSWQENGTKPYLSTIGDDAHKIYVDGVYFEEGMFDFEDFSPENLSHLISIDNVELRIQTKRTGTGSFFKIDVREQSNAGTLLWDDLSVTWGAYLNSTLDIDSFGYNTTEAINDFDICFLTAGMSAGTNVLSITYAEIIVLYTYDTEDYVRSAIEAIMDMIIPVLGASGMVMMMFTPLVFIKVSKRRKDGWVDAVTYAFVMAIMGFAFVVIWLWG